jgi:anti-sigma B factor antagonist
MRLNQLGTPVRESGNLASQAFLATGKEDTLPSAQTTKSLTFSVEHKGETALVHCRGQLVAGVGSEFAAHIRKLIPEHKKIVLDLTDLTKVDSMGLGTLVTLYTSAKRGGSCLELVNLGKQVRELLGITNLLSLFGDMCDKGVAIKF